MSLMLAQADGIGTILWLVIFFVFIIIYPRLMLTQLIWKVEQAARRLEEMSSKANAMIARKTGSGSSKVEVDRFTEFFAIEPSSLDPYGIVRKIDELVRQTETRFDEFVASVAGNKSYIEQQQINYGLRAAIGLKQIAKIVRHNVELAKKFKNLQIAMIIQMQMPIIEKIAEGEYKGAHAFANGWPIGDSIGPLIAASMTTKAMPIAKDIVMGEAKIDGRRAVILKATGPAPHLGRIDEAIEKVLRKRNIARVITVDAAQKLEGEKSGSVAEGVGFAMGGFSQREMIEAVLLPKKKPIDSVAIKVGMEEAMLPMKKEILASVPAALDAVRRAVMRAKPGQTVLVIGVGNSSGIPDTRDKLEEVKSHILKVATRMEAEEKKEKSGEWV